MSNQGNLLFADSRIYIV